MTEDNQTSTDLLPAERAIVALNALEAEESLKALAVKYVDVKAIKDGADYNMVKRGGIELMRARRVVEIRRDEVTKDAKQFTKAVRDKASELVAIITDEETRLKKLRADYEAELERKQKEKEAKEKARVDGIRSAIDELKQIIASNLFGTQEEMREALHLLGNVDLTNMAEFKDEAVTVVQDGQALLEQALADRIELDRKRAEQEAEEKRLAEQRRQIELERAETAKLMEEIQAKTEAMREAEEQRKAEEGRKQKEQEEHEEAETVVRVEPDTPKEERSFADYESEFVDYESDVVDAEFEEPQQVTDAYGYIQPDCLEVAKDFAFWLQNVQAPKTDNAVMTNMIDASLKRVHQVGTDLDRTIEAYIASEEHSEQHSEQHRQQG